MWAQISQLSCTSLVAPVEKGSTELPTPSPATAGSRSLDCRFSALTEILIESYLQNDPSFWFLSHLQRPSRRFGKGRPMAAYYMIELCYVLSASNCATAEEYRPATQKPHHFIDPIILSLHTPPKAGCNFANVHKKTRSTCPFAISRNMSRPMLGDGSAIWRGVVLVMKNRGSERRWSVPQLHIYRLTTASLRQVGKESLRAGPQSRPVWPRASSADCIRHQAVRILLYVARQMGAILQKSDLDRTATAQHL